MTLVKGGEELEEEERKTEVEEADHGGGLMNSLLFSLPLPLLNYPIIETGSS